MNTSMKNLVHNALHNAVKLSKTNYLIWRDCPHNDWIKQNRPDIYNANPPNAFEQGLYDTGNEVDELARDLFPNGTLVDRGDVDGTRTLIEARTAVLYQPVFETRRFTTACDILVWDAEARAYGLYEVKSSTTRGETKARRELYAQDLAFQAAILAMNDVPLGKLFLLTLDSRYRRGDALDVNALFHAEEFSADVAGVTDTLRMDMDAAHDWLSISSEPEGPCACVRRSRSNQCTSFSHINPDIPHYSVHDISRIGLSKKKLSDLTEAGIMDIREVPGDTKLSIRQANQVEAAKTGRSKIDHGQVTEFLSSMVYPLAFIDYETYPAGIPRFSGFHPFDQIPFQFSLDMISTPGAGISHHEFLATGANCPNLDCPDEAFIAALREALPQTGSIIVWNKKFEMTINKKLMTRNPADAAFLEDLNSRVIDLEDVFSKQAYVHLKFKGRSSIKSVLPVLVPALSYKTLDIQEGASASEAWNRMVSGELTEDEIQDIARNLLKYCALDTMAMVEIWRVLESEVISYAKTG